MAQGFTNGFAHALLDYITGGQGSTPSQGAVLSPPTWYVGLLTSSPVADGTSGVEVDAAEYARQPMSSSAWQPAGDPDARYVRNSERIEFPTVTTSGGWGTVVNVGIWDALTGGNLRMVAAITGGSVQFGEGATRGFDPSGFYIYMPWSL